MIFQFGSVNQDLDTRVCGRVKGCSQSPPRKRISTVAGDLQQDTVWIGLRLVQLRSSHQGQDLVTEDIPSRRNRRWDGDGVAVVVLSELVSSPEAGVAVRRAHADLADFGDFVKCKLCLVNFGAIAIAIGEVVQDRAFVALGPGGPLKMDVISSNDFQRLRTRGGANVADNVRIGEFIGSNESGF